MPELPLQRSDVRIAPTSRISTSGSLTSACSLTSRTAICPLEYLGHATAAVSPRPLGFSGSFAPHGEIQAAGAAHAAGAPFCLPNFGLTVGAKAVLLGRAYAYGLGAAGEAGVAGMILLLRTRVDVTIRHISGCKSSRDSSAAATPFCANNLGTAQFPAARQGGIRRLSPPSTQMNSPVVNGKPPAANIAAALPMSSGSPHRSKGMAPDWTTWSYLAAIGAVMSVRIMPGPDLVNIDQMFGQTAGEQARHHRQRRLSKACSRRAPAPRNSAFAEVMLMMQRNSPGGVLC